MTKNQKAKLKKQILSGVVLGGILMGNATVSAEITDSQEYQNDVTVSEDVNIADGHVAVISYYDRANINLNGNVTIGSTDDYALLAKGARSGHDNVLNVNMDGAHTVKIVGNVKAEVTHTDDGEVGVGAVNLMLSNSESYLAGSLSANMGTTNWSTERYAQIKLHLNNGATWYVPSSDSAYALSSATISVDADGGNIDLWHATPATVTRSTAGNRILGFSGVGTSMNGATFIVSSNAAADTADTVTLTGASGSNTYTVKVAYDPSATAAGEYNVAGSGATVLTSNNAGDTVVPGDYTATAVTSAGLLTKTLKYTPTLAVDNTGGTTVKLTKLTVTEAAASDGPAASMASAASAAQLAALGGWRAENNDLQRRLGDLRWDEGNAGAWARAYVGESHIHSGAGSDVSYHGIQVGYDRARNFGEGKLFTGIAFSNMKGDASGSAGSSDIDSKLFGVYGSYLGQKGHFIDAIIKYGRFTNDTTRIHNNTTYTGDYGTNGLNMSLEYGYHKQLHNGFYLEPQAELNYSHLNSSSYTMNAGGASGAFVRNNGVDSLIARVGVNAGRSTKDGNVYLKLSCLHEFNGDTGMTATYNGTTVNSSSSGSDTWLEYGVGFNQRVGKNQNLYGEITRTACADKVSDNWKANLGWRVSF